MPVAGKVPLPHPYHSPLCAPCSATGRACNLKLSNFTLAIQMQWVGKAVQGKCCNSLCECGKWQVAAAVSAATANSLAFSTSAQINNFYWDIPTHLWLVYVEFEQINKTKIDKYRGNI